MLSIYQALSESNPLASRSCRRYLAEVVQCLVVELGATLWVDFRPSALRDQGAAQHTEVQNGLHMGCHTTLKSQERWAVWIRVMNGSLDLKGFSPKSLYGAQARIDYFLWQNVI